MAEELASAFSGGTNFLHVGRNNVRILTFSLIGGGTLDFSGWNSSSFRSVLKKTRTGIAYNVSEVTVEDAAMGKLRWETYTALTSSFGIGETGASFTGIIEIDGVLNSLYGFTNQRIYLGNTYTAVFQRDITRSS